MSEAGSAPLLRLDAVEFAYPPWRGQTRRVLRGVRLAVDRGEVVVLLGTNGSGKSTLLRLAAGTLHASGGRVLVDARPVERLDRTTVARSVAVLPQSVDLPVGFSVAELVEMGRSPHVRSLFGSSPEDRRAIERAIAEADVADLADRSADELSGGERQRVLVAMALAQEPQLLLLDEPTLHLDLAHQVSLLETVRRLCRMRGIGVLAVVHDLHLAAAYADRVAVLHDGRIEALGHPREVLRASLVRRLFGVGVDEATTANGARYLVVTGAAGRE